MIFGKLGVLNAFFALQYVQLIISLKKKSVKDNEKCDCRLL